MKPVIIGAGLAGLTAALSLAPMPVILISSRKLGEESSSAWAQGGIAAAIGPDDSTELHAKDTIAAGAGLCDLKVVQTVTADGPGIIEFLRQLGVAFDPNLGLEAAHSRRRVIHAADRSGAAILQAVIAAVRQTPSIEVLEEASAAELLTSDGKISGVVIDHNGATSTLVTNKVVLATGGTGALWKETSNPLGSWGRGLLLAARAGAALSDLEFMQFHPTGIAIGRDPMPLASEALRGEGCTLIDSKGERFVDELKPRDVVARAIYAQRIAGEKTFLDARQALGENFAKRFPSIYASCQSAGIDPAKDPIPVSPAAHYHMGGVVTDLRGRSNVEGLWACGEVACTGLHGANRLASNSLLEAVSFGRRVAEDIAGNDRQALGNLKPLRSAPRISQTKNASEVREIMSTYVGVSRDAEGLQAAIDKLIPLAQSSDMALIGFMIAVAAIRREESRGSQTRTDFPTANKAWHCHQRMMLADIENLIEPQTSRRVAGV